MDETPTLAAQFASEPRSANARLLTVDTATRMVTLAPGGWRLHADPLAGAPTLLWTTRRAADATGALDGETAPVDADMVAGAVGTPSAGKAWANGIAGLSTESMGGTGCIKGVRTLRYDPSYPADQQWHAIAVPQFGYVNLYVRVASGSATPVLEGPFT